MGLKKVVLGRCCSLQVQLDAANSTGFGGPDRAAAILNIQQIFLF